METKLAHSLLAAAACFVLAFAPGCETVPDAPARVPESPAERWRADLAFAVGTMRGLHPDLYNCTSRERFDARVAAFHEDIPDLEEDAIRAELARIVALAGDSHTRSSALDPMRDAVYPVSFDCFGAELHVAAVQPGNERLFGMKLLAIEGSSTEKLLDSVAPFLGHENRILLRRLGASLLNAPRVLVQAGILQETGPCTFTLQGRDGALHSVRLEPVSGSQGLSWLWIAPKDYVPPLAESRKDETYWWRLLEEHGTIYFRYDSCRDLVERPFAGVAAQILDRIDAGGIRKLVIDVRGNGGGNSAVLRPLLRGIGERPERLPPGSVYVLIGPRTYSSAMLNAHQLRSRVSAVLVGEPTSQKPNCFGEIRSVELPCSRVRLECSTERFRLLDHDAPALEPDVLVRTSFEDAWRGRDPVLDWVLARP